MTDLATSLENTKVLILAGGFGTRLQSVVKDRPKPLAFVDDHNTFLDLQMSFLKKQKVRHFFLLTYHLHEVFVEHFKSQIENQQNNLTIQLIKEPRPFGTGGSVLNAIDVLQLNEPFILLNGDSFLDFDLSDFLTQSKDSQFSIIASHVDNAARFGKVIVDDKNHLINFAEKNGLEMPGLVNAGIYKINPVLLKNFERNKDLSLEKDIIPALLNSGTKIKIVNCKNSFIDIGTPESYQYFKDHLSEYVEVKNANKS